MRRLRVALTWASRIAAFAFVVMFVTPLVRGGSGASLSPVIAFIVTPIIFVVTLALALVWPRLGLIVVVATLLYPAWYYANTPPPDPRGALVPLDAEQRDLVHRRHFELRVAVDGGRLPPIYRTNLINDLNETRLFTLVGELDNSGSADLIALVTGTYYGDKEGHKFSLWWPQQPDHRVIVNVWNNAGVRPFLYASRHRLQVERLAWEVIRQIDALGPSGQATTPAPVISK
jgi:hypothetical protein